MTPPPVPNAPTVRARLVVAAGAIACIAAGRVWMVHWHRTAPTGLGEDFGIVLRAAERLHAGGDPWGERHAFRAALQEGRHPADLPAEAWPCLYPPSVLTMAEPLSLLRPATAIRWWGWVNLVLLAAGGVLAGLAGGAVRSAPPEGVAAPSTPEPGLRGSPQLVIRLAAAVPVVAVLMWPVRFNLYLGNTENVVLLLTAGAAWLLTVAGERRATAAGVMLGVAGAIKVLPLGVAVLPALWGGRVWQRVAAAALITFGVLMAAGVARAGVGSIAAWREATAVKTDAPGGYAAWPFNQSAGGFLHRTWSDAAAWWMPVEARPDLIAPLQWAWWGAVGLAAVAVLRRSRQAAGPAVGGTSGPHSADRSPDPREGGLSDAAGRLGFAACTIALLGPFTESYTVVQLLLPAAWVAAVALRHPSRAAGAVLGIGLVTALVLCGLRPGDWWAEATADGRGGLGDNLAVSRVWLGMVVLWACTAAGMVTGGRRSGAEAPVAPGS